jgi:branched-chain amino acid transport system permease protein
LLARHAGLGYFWALILAPLAVGLAGALFERIALRRLYRLDPLYGLLLTFGLALIVQGLFLQLYGSSGQAYAIPAPLQGAFDLGFMFLPRYRAWVILLSAAVCLLAWWLVERTKLGSVLRAATENPILVQAFGVHVPRLVTATYGVGVGLAALAGVLAAPIHNVSPLMGAHQLIVVFAVVVIGGMGSIGGAIASGFAVGVLESLTRVVYPEASSTVAFVLMVDRLAGAARRPLREGPMNRVSIAALVGALLVAPLVVYPVFLMKVLCFALFASAFHLLLGYVGLLSFGHAMFFGGGAYAAAHAARAWGAPPELALLLATAVAAVLGAAVGAVAIRRQGLYFAMITLGLAQMVYFVCLRADFTGGENGIQSVPRGTLFGLLDLGDTTVLYFFVVAVFLGGFAVLHRAIHSPLGEVLKAIREHEPRAVSLGYDVDSTS